MSDDNTAVAGEQPNAEQVAKGFAPIESQEDFDKRIQERIARERAKFGDYDDLKKAAERLAAIEDRDKSELDKANERAAAAERKAQEAEERVAAKDREVLVERVSAAKKVPAKYLSGSTVEELEASADGFLADIQAIVPDRVTGHVPSAGTGDPRPPAASLETGAERARATLGK
jgi:septal ring factor EnvC (AmiA/AmiB activator)